MTMALVVYTGPALYCRGHRAPMPAETFTAPSLRRKRLCRWCDTRAKLASRDAARGDVRCLECGELKPYTEYRESPGARRRRSRVCLTCEARYPDAPDDLAESLAEYYEALAHKIRWAVALRTVMRRYGLDLVRYRALRGAHRRAFEQEWDAEMIRLAKEAGEWIGDVTSDAEPAEAVA